jgi:hypothetical protein
LLNQQVSMQTISNKSTRVRDGLTRRGFLVAGALSAAGFTLADIALFQWNQGNLA